MLQEVFSVVTPVFIIAAIGFVWIKADQPFDNTTISSLVMMIGSPCLIFSSLTSNPPEWEVLRDVLASAALAIISVLAFAAIFLKIIGWKFTTYAASLSHANTGNMGLPLVLLAFGPEGLALGMAFFFVNSISQFTVGMTIASGSFKPLQLLKQPVIWSVLAVMICILGDLTPPQWLTNTTQILGGLTIPAMLLMLGTSIARLKATSIRETLVISILRLLLGFGVGHLAVWLFDLQGILAGVVILQCTMPAAVFNYVFADRFNREPEKVAAVVLISTVLSILTLPLLVAYVLTI
jgi:predicted permease